MQSHVLTTPSGHKVTFKPFVSFGDKRQIQRVFMEKVKVDPKNLENVDFDASSVYDAQDLAVKLLVTSIEMHGDNPQAIADPGEILLTVQGWPEKDGQAVYDHIDTLTNTVDQDLKKRGS